MNQSNAASRSVPDGVVINHHSIPFGYIRVARLGLSRWQRRPGVATANRRSFGTKIGWTGRTFSCLLQGLLEGGALSGRRRRRTSCGLWLAAVPRGLPSVLTRLKERVGARKRLRAGQFVSLRLLAAERDERIDSRGTPRGQDGSQRRDGHEEETRRCVFRRSKGVTPYSVPPR